MSRPKHLPQLLLFTALFLCALAPAQQISKQPATGERHTTNDPGSAIYQRSAFAHGFIHGYEQGYHVADLDYHVGRMDRKVTEAREYREVTGYHSNFGEKKTFQLGYRQGFLTGYDDSIHSRHFRAEIAGQAVAGGLKDFTGSNKELDAGFTAGYLAQRANPLNAVACAHHESPAYCNGFALGAEFAAISTGAASPFLAKEKLDALAVK